MFPEDLAYYEYFDSLGMSITGYPWAGDVFHDYSNRRDGDTDPMAGSPLFGHSPDFGYWYYGSIWYGDELWNGGRMDDLNGDGEEDRLDALWWNDNENRGPGTLFQDWTPATHPELGQVEVGGFHPKFFSQNAPPYLLEKWAKNEALFNLALAMHMPELQIDGVTVAAGEAPEGDTSDAPGEVYDVTVSFTNVGKLPSALRQAQLVKIVREDTVELEFDEMANGDEPAVEIIDPRFNDKSIYAAWIQPDENKEVTFKVRVAPEQEGPVNGTAHLLSTRGGHIKARFTIR